MGGKWTWGESSSVEDDENGSGAAHARSSSARAFKAGRNMGFYVGTLKPKRMLAMLLTSPRRGFEGSVYLNVSCNEQLAAYAKPPKGRGGWQAQSQAR